MFWENICLGQTRSDLWAQKHTSRYVPKWVKNGNIEKKSQNGHKMGKTGRLCLSEGIFRIPETKIKTLGMVRIGFGKNYLRFFCIQI